MSVRRPILFTFATVLIWASSAYCAQTVFQLDYEPPGSLITVPEGNYSLGAYQFDRIPGGSTLTDGWGAILTLNPGQGVTFYLPPVTTGPGLVHVQVSVRVEGSPQTILAVAGLNTNSDTFAGLDGSVASNLPINGQDYFNQWGRLETLIDPRGDTVAPVLQAVASGQDTVTVYFDAVTVTPLAELSAMDLAAYLDPERTTRQTLKINLPNMNAESIPLEMVLIQPGTFEMGTFVLERGRDAKEWPPHWVTITKPFYLSQCEVTQAQWAAITGGTPSTFTGYDNNPVEGVSWNDIQLFLQRLNGMGYGQFRLPTEAEWEFVCRAGTTTRYYYGHALDCADDCSFCILKNAYMWWCGNSGQSTFQVGLKIQNPWGLFDMHGNVMEWCADWYEDPSERGAQTDPLGPSTGSLRIVRGGSWNDPASQCRSGYRKGLDPATRDSRTGFRLVRQYP